MKLTTAILSTLLITFTALSSFAGSFDCDKAAADKALLEISSINIFKGDLELYKITQLNVIKAYMVYLESSLAKTTEEKNSLLQLAVSICGSEAP